MNPKKDPNPFYKKDYKRNISNIFSRNKQETTISKKTELIYYIIFYLQIIFFRK